MYPLLRCTPCLEISDSRLLDIDSGEKRFSKRGKRKGEEKGEEEGGREGEREGRERREEVQQYYRHI